MPKRKKTPDWVKQLLTRNGYTYKLRSVIDFMKFFQDDKKCLQYIANLRWGDTGWRCLSCDHDEYTFITTRKLIRCKNCHYEESFIANTVMRKTHKPLSHWMWTIYTIATGKTGISAMELMRQLDFGSYETAWTWLQKLRMAMVDIDEPLLKNDVEVDETLVFTGKTGTGRTYGSAKAIIVCAVEVMTSKKGHAISGRIYLRNIPSANRKNLHSFIIDHVEAGSIVRTDGWGAYKGLDELGYRHIIEPIRLQKEAQKKFPRIHRVFSNLKAWLIGTHRFVSKKHLQNYLNEYAYRFNARYDPIGAFNKVLRNAVLQAPREYRGFVKPREPIYVNP